MDVKQLYSQRYKPSKAKINHCESSEHRALTIIAVNRDQIGRGIFVDIIKWVKVHTYIF